MIICSSAISVRICMLMNNTGTFSNVLKSRSICISFYSSFVANGFLGNNSKFISKYSLLPDDVYLQNMSVEHSQKYANHSFKQIKFTGTNATW